MDESDSPNMRAQHRSRVLKGGVIITDIHTSVVNCTIRNMHSQGAELKVAPESIVPDKFLLYVSTDGIGYRSVVRWREKNRIGVEFLGEEPKPHWHYG